MRVAHENTDTDANLLVGKKADWTIALAEQAVSLRHDNRVNCVDDPIVSPDICLDDIGIVDHDFAS